MAARIVYKDKRMPYIVVSPLAPNHLPHAGYTVVFKDGVPEETVMKYMGDVVDADGRITQSYDWFLNVRILSAAADAKRWVLIASLLGFLRCHSSDLSPTPAQLLRDRLYR